MQADEQTETLSGASRDINDNCSAFDASDSLTSRPTVPDYANLLWWRPAHGPPGRSSHRAMTMASEFGTVETNEQILV